MPRFIQRPVVVSAERSRSAVIISTADGNKPVAPGEWIVTDETGNRHPVGDDVFRKRYAAIDREGELELLVEC